MNNADKIRAWRAEHSGVQVTERGLLDVLGLDTLLGVDLRYADLRGADLESANLWRVNMVGADLWRADLQGADLLGVDLRSANLDGASLQNADLQGANLDGASLQSANLLGASLHSADLHFADLWGGLRIEGAPSHQVTMVPTSEGWQISIGCWEHHALDGLRDLIEGREEWPEAYGTERERRLPYLSAILTLAEAHAVYHADKLDAVIERWVP